MCTSILLENDPLIIADRQFNSRFNVGTGKYKTFSRSNGRNNF